MTRILELIVAGAVGAALPTAASIFYAKPLEVTMDTPTVSLCSSYEPCHIVLPEPVSVRFDDAVPVSIDNTVAVSIADAVPMDLGCGGPLKSPCEVKLKQDLVSPIMMQLMR